MPVGKLFLYTIFAMVLGVVYFLFIREEPSTLPRPAQQTAGAVDNATTATTRRGDDTTYAEEVRRNTELTRATQDKQENLERQLAEAREQSSNDSAALQTKLEELKKQLAKMEQTTQTAREAEQNAAKAVMADEMKALQESIDSLKQSHQTTQAASEARIAQLEQELAASRAGAGETPPLPVDDKPPLPDVYGTGSITLPYSFAGDGAAARSAAVRQSERATSDTAASAGGDLLSEVQADLARTFGGTAGALANGVPDPQPTTRARPLPQPGQVQKEAQWPTVFPVYTLPPLTTLSDALLVTPIIGRVPIRNDRQLDDPYFFRAEIGGKNLAANGHQIPGVAKMIVSGYATGVREQSCVRGYIDALTFIFIDGRIVSHGQASHDGTSSGDALGYLTDPWGKPCLRGRYINNAGEYLYSRGTAAFIEAAAEGLAQSQVNYRQDNNGNFTAMLDGNIWRYVFGKGISGTASEFADYVRERTAGAFDVVYVEQGRPVQIMLNKQIEIDYDAKARKVNYYTEPRRARRYD
ncbi:TrbI/VirB10 family protein [uncultured Cardiobacterium sp.]|uniref:TrbI/VirB10 family protein n=1 Tax=uncultured Cardiobacterium sp. TaxID=417619 RepID=UPI002611AA07|nr:TrbI/VirB10 family protein [uncultured Cardiobacterium sp.]